MERLPGRPVEEPAATFTECPECGQTLSPIGEDSPIGECPNGHVNPMRTERRR